MEKQESKKTYKVAVTEGSEVDIQPKSTHFKTFQFQGKISGARSDSGLPVVIQRDTASDQSIILRSAIPNIEQYFTGKSVLLAGVGGTVTLPLCKLFIESDLVTGFVDFAVEDSLAIDNIHILLGNEVGGEKVVPNPIVTPVPVLENSTLELEQEHPYLFPSCVTTRSKSQGRGRNMTGHDSDDCSGSTNVTFDGINNAGESDIGLNGLFSGKQVTFGLENVTPVTRDNLIRYQKSDPTLENFLYRAVPLDETTHYPQCYYLRNGVLMRKFRRHDVPQNASWGEYHQIVLPTCLQSQVISLSHDLGHLGIKKTLAKIMKYFFWPGINSDVSGYIRRCHSCQLAGKGTIKRAPLNPIKVTGEPFEKVLIDCVGPLPKTKKGNEYLLTIMDPVTRYPEAFPIRSIHSKVIIGS